MPTAKTYTYADSGPDVEKRQGLMTTQSNPQLVRAFRIVSQGASSAVIGAGVVALVGWLFDVQVLKSLHPDWVTMKANTALGFLLAGCALWLSQPGPDLSPPAPRRLRLALLLAFVVALLGGLTLVEFASGWDLGIDQLLFKEPPGAVGTFIPGRMAPNTALCFLLVGLALLGSRGATRLGKCGGQMPALLAGLIGLLGVLGYLYHAPGVAGLAGCTRMALHTALAFLAATVGFLFLYPDRGLPATLTAEGPGGRLARQLVPAAFGVPLAIGWLRALAQERQLLDSMIGLALGIVAHVVIFAALIWWSADSLERTDSERREAEAALLERTRELDRFFSHSLELLLIADADGFFRRLNPKWEEVLGYPLRELEGHRFLDYVHPDDVASTVSQVANLAPGQEVFEFVNRCRCKDGGYRWLQWSSYSEGSLVYAAARDITERVRSEKRLKELHGVHGGGQPGHH